MAAKSQHGSVSNFDRISAWLTVRIYATTRRQRCFRPAMQLQVAPCDSTGGKIKYIRIWTRTRPAECNRIGAESWPRTTRWCNPGMRRRQRQCCQPLLCRSEEHTSELQSLMRISYAVFCLKKKKKLTNTHTTTLNTKTH